MDWIVRKVGLTKYGFLSSPNVPGPDPRIYTCATNHIPVNGMPVDVRYCTIVSL